MSSAEPLRVYYMSSGNLGVSVLRALRTDSRVILVGVGSQPDRPSGRKKRMTPTIVAQEAAAFGMEVDKPENTNDPAYLEKLRGMNLDFIVVASFGQILRRTLLEMPKYGCLNVHASLLPRYRGASPIAAAILGGEAYSGITYMAMDAGLDTGAIYSQLPVKISAEDTTASLEASLARVAGERIVDTLCAVADGVLHAKPQDSSIATYAGKIQKADGGVRWGISAAELSRRVRAYQPWPTVFMLATTDRGEVKRLQITKAQPEDLPVQETAVAPGTLLEQGERGLLVACGSGAIRITRLVPEGRKEMSVADFLRGTRLPESTIFNDYPTGEHEADSH